MLKKQLFVIILICSVAATISGNSGLINEMKIDSPKNKLQPQKRENTSETDSSMYAKSNLGEETASKLDGPDSKEKDGNNTDEKQANDGRNKREEISSVYTESDMEATGSQDATKHGGILERERRSIGSLLHVPHKRDIETYDVEASGEGSGGAPTLSSDS